MKEEALGKEKKRAIVFVPETDSDGHSVFRCLNKDDEALVKTALGNPMGVKVKSAEGKTCPIEPEKPYNKSVCGKIDAVLKKAAKKAIKEGK